MQARLDRLVEQRVEHLRPTAGAIAQEGRQVERRRQEIARPLFDAARPITMSASSRPVPSEVVPDPYDANVFHVRRGIARDRDLIFLARPGMTGYWQVEARNEVSFAERQAMEAHYVRNWSVWWDLEILLRTPLAMLGPDGK